MNAQTLLDRDSRNLLAALCMTHKDLTGQDGCAMIMLDEQVYTLRITRAGKLILTK